VAPSENAYPQTSPRLLIDMAVLARYLFGGQSSWKLYRGGAYELGTTTDEARTQRPATSRALVYILVYVLSRTLCTISIFKSRRPRRDNREHPHAERPQPEADMV